MFGWVERVLNRAGEALYRRGQSIVDGADRAQEERRDALRTVRDALSGAMTHAEEDREHGAPDDRRAAVESANRASSVVHEIDDEDARRFVLDWKRSFDSIQKGWKDGGFESLAGDRRLPRGYPEPDWSELRQLADAALDRIGTVLRRLLEA